MVGGQRQNPDPTQSGCFSIAHLMRIGIARGRDTCGDTGRGKHQSVRKAVGQRKGDEGFGEGNFRALFESIEEDQIRRGMIILDAAE